MNQQVIITTDSAADLPQGIREEYGIPFIPLYIALGERAGRDSVDIFPMDVYKAYTAQGIYPKTSAPSIGDFEAFFRQYTEQGRAVVHISIGAAYSSSAQAARMAALAMPESEIHVVDSGMFTTAQGTLCVRAARLRDEGLSAEEIAARAEEIKGRVRAHIYLDKLDMVARGGRVPALAALGANLLQIHPSVILEGGNPLKMGKKYRGKSAQAQRAWLEDAVAALRDAIDPALVFFLHTPEMPPETVEALAGAARALLPARLEMAPLGCTCLVHSGFNCVGLAAAGK